MRFGWNANVTSARLSRAAKMAALLFLAAYALIYWVEPFSDLWNVFLSDSFLVIAAATSACIATLIRNRYDQADAPRRIWVYFAMGLWLWTAAELVWGYLNVTQGEVPEGIADLFWIGGYVCFAQALFVQYQILAHPNRQEIGRLAITLLFILVIFYLLVYGVLTNGIGRQGDLGTAINSFYPVADLLLALVALWLARRFMGGAFARPWFGLLAFCFADLLFAWIEFSGLYAWSVDQANILSTITDIVYLAAYLVLGVSILSQWAFLKYGMRSPTLPLTTK